MIVVVVLLAVVAVAALVAALVTRSRLTAQRARAAAAETERDEASARADDATARADTNESRATEAETQAADATTRATDAETRAAEAETLAADAETRATTAESKAADAEALAADAAARNGLDPELLWTLERARSERTWRQSVAVGPDDASVFTGATAHPLREALQVEVDAAREEVGAIVELDVDVPDDVTAAGSVLVLRAAQELLARAVKAAEEATLRVQADGADLVVTIVATDEDGSLLPVAELDIPPTADVESVDGGVRVKRAIPSP